MNTGLLAFYTSPNTAKIGYRWVWADPAIPTEILERLYSSLAKPLTPSDNPAIMNGGVISLGNSWCAVFRWVDAGRDAAGRSGKLGLIAAILPRNQLAGLDLLAVLNSDIFAHPTEEQPTSTSLPIPRFPAPPPATSFAPGMKRELPGLHQYPELLSTAAAIPDGDFLLELQRDTRGEFCRLTTRMREQTPRLQTPPPSAVAQSTPRGLAMASEVSRPKRSLPWGYFTIATLIVVIILTTYSHFKSKAVAHADDEIATLQLSVKSSGGMEVPLKAEPTASEFIEKVKRILNISKHADSQIPILLGQPHSVTRYATISHNEDEYEVSVSITIESQPVEKRATERDIRGHGKQEYQTPSDNKGNNTRSAQQNTEPNHVGD